MPFTVIESESNEFATVYDIGEHQVDGPVVFLTFDNFIHSPTMLTKWEINGFESNGPELPLSFSRIEGNGIVALVTDPVNGRPCQTHYAVLNDKKEISKNVSLFSRREGTAHEHIGCIDFESGRARCVNKENDQQVIEGIVNWAKANNFSRVVWSDAPSNFLEVTRKKPTLRNVREHLDALPKDDRDKAFAYVKNAPENVRDNAYPANLASSINSVAPVESVTQTEQQDAELTTDSPYDTFKVNDYEVKPNADAANSIADITGMIERMYRADRSNNRRKSIFSPFGRSIRAEQINRIKACQNGEDLYRTLESVINDIDNEWHFCGESNLKKVLESVLGKLPKPLSGENDDEQLIL